MPKIKIYGNCQLCKMVKFQFTDEQVEKLPFDGSEFMRLQWSTQPLITYNDELVDYLARDKNKSAFDNAKAAVNELLKSEELK